MRLNLPLLVFFLILTLSACTHKRLINAGDDYLAQGQYQQAVEKYQRALTNKPDDKKTLQKFNQANTLFENWLDTIDNAALQAEQNKEFGKATILYAKLATHRSNTKYKQKQRQLYQKNLNDYGLRVALNIQNPQLNQAFGQVLESVVFVNETSNKPNELTLLFTLDNIKILTNNKTNLKSTEYISHYETILNPEFQELQQVILIIRKEMKELRHSVSELKELKHKQQIQQQLIDKDLQIAQLKINQTNNSNTQFQQLTKQIYYLEIDFIKQEKLIAKTNKRINLLQQDIDIGHNDLDDLFATLQTIEKLIDEPIYSEYQYTVNTITQTASSILNIDSDSHYLGNISRKNTVKIRYSDQYHKTHERIELEANPKKIKTKTQLTQMLYIQVRKQIVIELKKSIMQYQQALIVKANNNSNIKTRLNQWLIAGIISKQGLPRDSVNRIEQQLYSEFGFGGSFNVNALLSSN